MDIFNEPRRSGRPRTDDRLMLNGVLWVPCSGAAWRDMPERFGPWSTVYQRFRDWRNRGTFDQMLKRLHIKLNEQGLIDLETWMIDSTAVRATRASSGAGKIYGRAGKPATPLMPSRCWIRHISQVCAVVPVNAVGGCWQIKAMTPKLCVVTATGIGCSQ